MGSIWYFYICRENRWWRNVDIDMYYMGRSERIKHNRYNIERDEVRALAIAGGSVIFINMILPLFDGLTNMAISAINKTVNKWSLDMELDRREAEAAAETISPTGAITQAIGFHVPSESNDDEYYEDKKR